MSAPPGFDHAFDAVLTGDMGPHRWTCVIVTDSVPVMGTAKAVAVTAEVDGRSFTTSLLPYRGHHMLPVKRPVLDAIGKAAGDVVAVRLRSPAS